MPWDSIDPRRDEDDWPRERSGVADRSGIVAFCNDLLSLHRYPDYGPMGLQFKGDEKVNKVASAVSISLDVIDRAAREGANLLVVHHGMFWNNESRVLDDRVGGRLKALEATGMSVLAYHLALDAHPEIGNNILLARNLGLSKLHRWQDIGYSGQFKLAMSPDDFAARVWNKLGAMQTPGYTLPPKFASYVQTDKIDKVAVIAGGAAHYIVQAHRDGFDTFVTGENTENAIYLAQDLKMNFFAFGHDKTERSGVQKLGQRISKKFRVPHVFLPVENPA